jgi:hypothetical protein
MYIYIPIPIPILFSMYSHSPILFFPPPSLPAQITVEPDAVPPIPDPLGISSVDLRSIQAFYASGTYYNLLWCTM